MFNKRTFAFYYTTLVLFGLLAGAAWYQFSSKSGFLFTEQRAQYALLGGWWAMIGGVAIGYKGIVEHRTTEEWTNGWLLWYIVRPFSSFVVGIVTYSVLQVANPSNAPSSAALAIAAFIFGTQERRFFGFLTQVAALILTTKDEAMQITAIAPETGAAGTALLIQGMGFQAKATATIGGQPLGSPAVASDGTSLAGVVPALPAGAAADAQVVVVNPDHTAASAPKNFTYT